MLPNPSREACRFSFFVFVFGFVAVVSVGRSATAQGPVVDAVAPQDVLPDELTAVYVIGANLTNDTRVTFPGAGDLVDPVALIDEETGFAQIIVGYTPILPVGDPAFPIGWKDVVVSDERGTSTAKHAFYYVDYTDIYLKHCWPRQVGPEGGTRIHFYGKNFREGLLPAFYVPGDEEALWICTDPVILGDTEMMATIPAIPARPQYDFYAAVLLDGTDPVARREGAMAVYDGSRPPTILSVEPTEANARGGTRVEIRGESFEARTAVIIGDILTLDEAELVSPELIIGIAQGVDPLDPRTPPGYNDVVVTDERGSTALSYGLLFVDKIRSVTPYEVSTDGGTRVVFEGFGFENGFVPRLGGEPLLDVAFVSAERIEGTAPPLALGTQSATLTDEFETIVGYLPDAVEVLTMVRDLAAPAEIDAVYAEGEARFTWSNPVAYDRIVATELLAGGGIGRVFELPGDLTSLLVPSTRDGVALELTGFLRERISIGSLGYAYPAECGQPVPLGGYGIAGKYDFPLFGGNLPKLPVRCAPAARARAGRGDGAGAGFFDLAEEWASINGFVQVGEGYGVTARDRNLDFAINRFSPHRYSNRLVTGFTLESDADRLQIEGFYQKIGEASGLALMGRLIHVWPEDGFEDEFTLPDATPGEEPGWHGFTYFRADRDVAEKGAQPCGLKIPAGDYILQLYAINGAPDQSYYLFRDDARDVELLIPGAPCPPYPLVRIRDVSGKRTLPNITDISAVVKNGLQIEFRAIGSWFDGVSPQAHSIDPFGPNYIPHDFEFCWTVESAVPAVMKSSFSSNSIVVPVSAIGCHRVHLTVRDRACDRAVSVSRQAIVAPAAFTSSSCVVRPYAVQNPTPNPTGIIAIAGLNPAPGEGRMARPRPLSLRVLITAESLSICGGDARVVAPDVLPTDPPGGGDIVFQLVWSYLDVLQFPPQPRTLVALDATEILRKNLCRSVNDAPYTYFEVTIPDLGKVRPLPIFADNGVLQPVKLQWKTNFRRVKRADGSIAVEPSNDSSWHDVEPSFRMTNSPASLSQNRWQGFYSEPSQTYRFVYQASDNYQSSTSLGETRRVPVGLPVVGRRIEIPAMKNRFGAGLNTEIEFANGVWSAGTAKVDSGGEILQNEIQGSTLQVEPSTEAQRHAEGAAQGLGGLRDAFEYTWCKQHEIFNKTHEQELFNALVFATTIPPGIPVTVWASVGLALKVAITAQAGVVISLFDGLEDGSFVKSDLYFNSELGLHIPASIRADVLFGVASVAFKLIPSVNAAFRAHVGNRDLEFSAGAELNIYIKLLMEIELCILGFLKEVPIVGDVLCNDVYSQELVNAQLIDSKTGDPFQFEACPEGDGERAFDIAGDRAAMPDGAGHGGDIRIRLEEYFPAAKSSRDGSVSITVGYQKSDVSTIRAPITRISVKLGDAAPALFATREAWELEPSIGFLSNDRALIAWTRSFPQEVIDLGAPVHPDGNYSNDELNFFRAHDEIVITPVFGAPTRPDFWDVEPDFILSDPRDEVPDPAARRVDGRASVAGDEVHHDALVAWVRVDDPAYFVAGAVPGERRIQLEKTAIFARSVGFDGVLDVAQRLSGDGINIEPSVAFSPSGNVAYCVWVNDPVHIDLLGSNRGRNLVYSVWDRATNTWTVPQAIFADPDSRPGMLEPAIALRGDDYGLLAFTAMEASAEESDSGLLGGSRYVYISRLEGGVFGEPMLVHGKCEKRVFGSQVVIEIPPRGQDPLTRALNKWEWQVLFQQSGSGMSLESAGGLMTAGLPFDSVLPTPAVAVLADGNVRSNVVATATAAGLQVMSLNLGPSLRSISLVGAGRGLALEPLSEGVFESTDIVARPDLAVAACELSNRFSGPGAMVTAKVRVENDGLLGSAANDRGESLVGLEMRYIDATGVERVVATAELPVIDAGSSAEITITLEQPLDPVRLVAALNPNPIDPNPANDFAQCYFGTPEPRDFSCEAVAIGDDERELATRLQWTNPVPYEELILYRDGSMLSSLPGETTSYVDRAASSGSHSYEIRARIEVSKSCRVAVLCESSVLPATFRRGDADANGRVEITDAIVTLGYLFLGSRAPECIDAGDSDDSGRLEITDAIRLLSYLFLGGATLPAPGPNNCGDDPTLDELSCDQSPQDCLAP